MKNSLILTLLIGLASFTAYGQTSEDQPIRKANGQDKWHRADEAVVGLKPDVFSLLPKNLVLYLNARRCTIPQSFEDSTSHNVIRGQFAQVGQFDWAVLCSRNGVSSILVFWKGSTRSVAEIARSDDKSFLQTINGAGKIGFSRAIGVVDKNYILEHYRQYGGRKPPQVEHQGINDAFIEKASSVRYFYRRRWLELQGAD